MHPRLLILGIGIIGLIGILWQVAVDALHIPTFLLPPPSAVLAELFDRAPLYLDQTASTLAATVLGFGIAAIAGIFVGSAIAYSWLLRGLLYPPILVLQVVPKVALAPLVVVWVGFGLPSRVLMAAVISFFPIVVNTIVGLGSVEPELLDLVRGLRGSRLQEFTKIAFPHAMPFIFSGLKVAATLAVIGAVVAEFIGGNQGLGYLILVGNSDLNVSMAFGALVVLSVMGLALFGAIDLLERICVPWADERDENVAGRL